MEVRYPKIRRFGAEEDSDLRLVKLAYEVVAVKCGFNGTL
jgi:hypothetical protein